jgi:hypothetical protein
MKPTMVRRWRAEALSKRKNSQNQPRVCELEALVADAADGAQVGSDELVSTLDVLIECYASRMPPYAEGLCTR